MEYPISMILYAFESFNRKLLKAHKIIDIGYSPKFLWQFDLKYYLIVYHKDYKNIKITVSKIQKMSHFQETQSRRPTQQ